MRLSKRTAIEHFGGLGALAQALSITKSAISQWPDLLTAEQQDRVISSSWRIGRPLAERRSNGLPEAA